MPGYFGSRKELIQIDIMNINPARDERVAIPASVPVLNRLIQFHLLHD